MAKRRATEFYSRLEKALEHRWHEKPTQAKIGERLGVGQSAVSYWKNTGPPSMEIAIELAEMCGLCVEYLLTGRGPMYPDAARGDPFLEAVCSIVSGFKPDEKVRFLEYLRWRVTDIGSTWPESVEDALERLKDDTGRHKKLS